MRKIDFIMLPQKVYHFHHYARKDAIIGFPFVIHDEKDINLSRCFVIRKENAQMFFNHYNDPKKDKSEIMHLAEEFNPSVFDDDSNLIA